MTARIAAAILLLGSLMVGFAQVAQLPPWEGFDETQHYSYLQQIAETGRWPRFGDPISAELADYLKVAPTTSSIDPPWPYRKFFAASPDTIERGRAAIHGEGAERRWRPGDGANWEAQHPPLYYLLLSPAYLVSRHLSLAAHLFVLRGFSYVIAWVGLCVATICALRAASGSTLIRTSLFLAPALWPALFPMWFPEMARLGNDCLVVLLAACTWWSLTRLDAEGGGLRHYGLLAVTCGLGLVTKATFLPLVAAIGCFLCFRAWQERAVAAALRQRLIGIVLFGAVVALMSGWWYLNKYLETGNFLGSNDLTLLREAGGMLDGLRKHGSWPLFLRGLAGILYSFLWAGTWSFVIPPFITLVPLIVLSLMLLGGYICQAVKRQPTAVEWVPTIMLAGFMAALLHHQLVFLASIGNPGVPGWYIHSLMPVLAVLLGYGLATMMSHTLLRVVFLPLAFYPLLFLAAAFAVQGLFYAGCADTPFRRTYAEYVPLLSCLRDAPTVLERLAVISFPNAMLTFFAVGWVLLLFGLSASLWIIGRTASRPTP